MLPMREDLVTICYEEKMRLCGAESSYICWNTLSVVSGVATGITPASVG